MSARDHRDKALLVWRGRTLLEHAIDRLQALTDDVRILCGPKERYGEFSRPLVLDELCGVGPIAGLHAALHATDSERIVWIGVDLPRVTVKTLRSVLDATGSVAAVARSPRGLEPLCASFATAQCRARVVRSLGRGTLKLTDAIGAADIRLVDGSLEEFLNVNSPDDAAALGITV
jgi:molybdopterin-guanine dinucleotide biosynthesis protein A